MTYSKLLALTLCAGTVFGQTRQLNFRNSSRFHDLIRAGNLYLSLPDALALGIENNLDIELSRYNLSIVDTDLLRAKGGGLTRGAAFDILEAPIGVGGPLSPVLTSVATSTIASGTSVSSNPLELGALSEQLITNMNLQGEAAQSTGPPVPIYDPAIVGQLAYNHQTTPQPGGPLVVNSTMANAGIQQGFGSGGQVSLTFDHNRQMLYTGSSLGLTVTQPLLRGFVLSLNRRFIEIAKNDQRISSLLFRQQLIATVYGVVRLYTDLVALGEDVKVKQESVALAEKLFSDTRAQVEEGTLAQVEMTRANALVFSSRQDLINSRGLFEEQEAILKNFITRRGTEDPEVEAASIIPTDPLTIPVNEDIRPTRDLIADALANRPDLGQARLQIQNSEIGLKGTRNAVLPEVDLVGVAQNNGLGDYGGVLDQLFTRKYPTYSVGVQVTIPIRNRIAEADLARDELQMKQSQIRQRQLLNQASLEVEDALIAMRRARASYEAAVQARVLQQESLEAEQAKFEVGASTSFFVIQYESLLAQTKSTEVAAKSAYVKARNALQRATGSILDANQISIDTAIKGRS